MKPLFNLSLVILCLLCSQQINAQNDPVEIVIGNWENSMDSIPPNPNFCVLLMPDGLLVIHGQVQTAQNDMKPYPEAYLQYDFGNGLLSGITPQITNANLVPIEMNGWNLYQADFIFIIDLTDECNSNQVPLYLPFDYTMALVTPDGFGYKPYPASDYPALFPPMIFPEVLIPGFQPVYSGTKEICCTMVTAAFNSAEESDQNIGTDLPEQQTTIETEGQWSGGTIPEGISVFPNPFQDNIQIQTYLATTSDMELKMFDARGKVVLQQTRQILQAGLHQGEVSTENLVPGIYYLQINTGQEQVVHKLVKMK